MDEKLILDSLQVAIGELGQKQMQMEELGRKLNSQMKSVQALQEAFSIDKKLMINAIRELRTQMNEVRGI